MTVSSELNRKEYVGNGSTTSFATSPVVFFDSSDLKVYVVTTATGAATLLTETTDYTVTGGSGAVGTVATTGLYGAPSASQTLVIVRELPLTQGVDFVQNDASDAEVMEDALDKLVMSDQQLSAKIDRSFTLADSDVSGASTELPTPTASRLLGWNSDGDGLTNYAASDLSAVLTTAFTESLLDDASAGVFVETLRGGLTADTAPAVDDEIITRDTTNTTGKRMTLENALKVINGLTTDSAPVGSTDYVVTYDASASAAKKVLIDTLTALAFSTGDVKLTLKTTADTGWVLMNDGTIGNASSGGTTRANADTESLFTLLWTNTADAQCAVSTGRGASAAADFAANKTIALPKALGRALAVYGAGSGLTSRALALVTGVETHALSEAELASHTHGGATGGATATISGTTYDAASGTANSSVVGGGTGGTFAGSIAAFGVDSHAHSIAAAGSGTAHQNMQPTAFLNVMIKL